MMLMQIMHNQKIFDHLFDLISKNEDNEEEIITILLDPKNKNFIKCLINSPDPNTDETLLMMAVWRLKENTVLTLIRLGANINYKNIDGDSVSTYWNLNSRNSNNKQFLAGQIARILHHNGAILYSKSHHREDLITKAKEKNLIILLRELKKLGYDC